MTQRAAQSAPSTKATASSPSASIGKVTPPAATPTPKPIDPAKNRCDARVVDELLVPAQLHALLRGDKMGVGTQGVHAYLADITKDAKDPIEKMMLQQFVVAHHRLMQLHVSADEARDAETIRVFNAAAARLQGELRRLALAIRLYRAPVSPKTFTVVEQQNVATQQEVNFHSHGPDHKKLHVRDSKLGSNPEPNSHDDTSSPASNEGSGPGANRLRESGALEGVHAVRA